MKNRIIVLSIVAVFCLGCHKDIRPNNGNNFLTAWIDTVSYKRVWEDGPLWGDYPALIATYNESGDSLQIRSLLKARYGPGFQVTVISPDTTMTVKYTFTALYLSLPIDQLVEKAKVKVIHPNIRLGYRHLVRNWHFKNECYDYGPLLNADITDCEVSIKRFDKDLNVISGEFFINGSVRIAENETRLFQVKEGNFDILINSLFITQFINDWSKDFFADLREIVMPDQFSDGESISEWYFGDPLEKYK